jgi:dihydroorotase
MIGLESAYGVITTAFPILVKKKDCHVSSHPAKIAGLPIHPIAAGNKAVITLFEPKRKWIFTEKNIRSKSKNSPFLNKELTGFVTGIVNGTHVLLNNP